MRVVAQLSIIAVIICAQRMQHHDGTAGIQQETTSMTTDKDHGMPAEEHLENQENMEQVGHMMAAENEKEHVELEVVETMQNSQWPETPSPITNLDCRQDTLFRKFCWVEDLISRVRQLNVQSRPAIKKARLHHGFQVLSKL